VLVDIVDESTRVAVALAPLEITALFGLATGAMPGCRWYPHAHRPHAHAERSDLGRHGVGKGRESSLRATRHGCHAWEGTERHGHLWRVMRLLAGRAALDISERVIVVDEAAFGALASAASVVAADL
jgi:hypothetical protein